MGSDDSTPERCFTADDTDLAESAYDALHYDWPHRLSDKGLAAALLALVRECSEIRVSVSNVRIVVTDDKADIEVPQKTLRVLPCCTERFELTWGEVRFCTPELPIDHEWLVVTTRSMTPEAKQRIAAQQGESAMHYIELTGRIQEQDESGAAEDSGGADFSPAGRLSRVEKYSSRKPKWTASERRLRRN